MRAHNAAAVAADPAVTISTISRKPWQMVG